MSNSDEMVLPDEAPGGPDEADVEPEAEAEPDADAKSQESIELKNEVESLVDDYPIILYDLFNCIMMELEDGSENRKMSFDNEKKAMECSILADIEGYRPHLRRLASGHPKLYKLHSGFFNMAVNRENVNSLLKKRMNDLSVLELEPILCAADGSTIPIKQDEAEPAKKSKKTGRNDPCPCGSGKKFKKCCGA